MHYHLSGALICTHVSEEKQAEMTAANNALSYFQLALFAGVWYIVWCDINVLEIKARLSDQVLAICYTAD